jgi:hypothetical protein
MSSAFNPKNCPMDPVEPIPAIAGIEDCAVVGDAAVTPERMQDCPDQALALPAPGRQGMPGPPGVAGSEFDILGFFDTVTFVGLSWLPDTLTLENTRESGGGSGGDDTSNSVLIVLIEDDIPGITEADPICELTAENVVLTTEEIAAEYAIQLQDPAPEDGNFDDNPVDSLNLLTYSRVKLILKFFHPAKVVLTTGTATAGDTDTITISDDDTAEDGAYVDSWITITDGVGVGQEAQITANSSDHVLTVTPAWPGDQPDATSLYEIARREPCYDPDTNKLNLATTVIDDPDHVPPRKIVRFATTQVFYDDGKPLALGTYKKQDYPGYPEEVFPPDGTGTYEAEDPSFFKKRVRGIAINGVLVRELCKDLPPRPLTLRTP